MTPDEAYNVRSCPDYKLDTGHNHRKPCPEAQNTTPFVQCDKPCDVNGLCPSCSCTEPEQHLR